jgi:glycosyltransferase involved in cell wall biosynthesis
MTTFSVIVPTHNRIDLLQRAIRSVLNQVAIDFELIVVDDGSSDGTTAWLATLKEPRLRVIRRDTPRGASAARNAGIQAAQGRLIAFLDDDDEYRSEFLARHYESFSRNVVLGWAWSGVCRHFWQDGGETRIADQIWHEADRERRYLTQLAASYGLVVRRECFAEIGLFDESMPVAEDVDLLFRLEAAGIGCAPVPEVLIDIHIHTGASLSRNEDWSRFVDSYRILLAKNKSLLSRYPLLWQHYHDSLAGHLYRIGDHRTARKVLWQIFRHTPWQLAGLSKFLRSELKRLKF